jgi:hypothetical protein
VEMDRVSIRTSERRKLGRVKLVHITALCSFNPRSTRIAKFSKSV